MHKNILETPDGSGESDMSTITRELTLFFRIDDAHFPYILCVNIYMFSLGMEIVHEALLVFIFLFITYFGVSGGATRSRA